MLLEKTPARFVPNPFSFLGEVTCDLPCLVMKYGIWDAFLSKELTLKVLNFLVKSSSDALIILT